MFRVKRLHQYLYGRHLIIRSDHKPLMFISDESKVIPQQHQLGSRDGPSCSVAIPITFCIKQVGSVQMQMASAGYTSSSATASGDSIPNGTPGGFACISCPHMVPDWV